MKFKCLTCGKFCEFPLAELTGRLDSPACPHCLIGFLLPIEVKGPKP